MIAEIERIRLSLSSRDKSSGKSELGQFFTPSRTARFMASLFPSDTLAGCRLLDPGAGIGSLSAAFLERIVDEDLTSLTISIDAYEIDSTLCPYLKKNIKAYESLCNLSFSVHNYNFVAIASDFLAGDLFSKEIPLYSHAILNPPYKKIGCNSSYRLSLRRAGIETVNLYSGFVSLALGLIRPGGHLVAIIPRSFCNGPYYRSFRNNLLNNSAIHQIHLFTSRNSAFKDESVLQENVIIHLEKNAVQRDVTITTSTDDSFEDIRHSVFPFSDIVLPEDTEQFIHIPVCQDQDSLKLPSLFSCTLDDLGIQVSTGPVVDFRLKQHLRDEPQNDTVPLLYPCHFNGLSTEWPQSGIKKPNAIALNSETERWLFPNGCYCVVRRFSSKEEKRRIIAGIVNPDSLGNALMLGFENHLNIFHENRRGLPEALAKGLACYLSTKKVDDYFRRFNGHTQVNATDLKKMKYPCRELLIKVGLCVSGHKDFSKIDIDKQFEE